MTKQIRLNAFAMNTVGHLSPGLWRHPRDQATRYTDIHYWIELAQTLERGCIDG
ncbi:TPA: 5,10-methylene tetrahydromethanopterin reductase, partial [Pseudomonas putida]|nr:5,10-methylene tetrahydromethanopterin reductase [Pseudomonas putida]